MKKVIFLKIVLIFVAILPTPSWSNTQNTLILTDSALLLENAHKIFKDVLQDIPVDIERDYKSKEFITGEGAVIPFEGLFHNRSAAGNSVLQQLNEEYDLATISLFWMESGKVKKYSAYGLTKRSFRLHVKVIDLSNGKTIIDKSVLYESKFKLKPLGDREELRNKEIFTQALSKFDLEKIRGLLTHYFKDVNNLGNKIRIAINGIDQKEYFEKRDDLLAVIKSVGVNGALRDSYDRGKKILTIRVGIDESISKFYRAFYQAVERSNILDNFDINRSGRYIELKELPVNTKRFVINGLTSDRYHSRLNAYQSALEMIKGVRAVEYKFISGENASELVFNFISKNNTSVIESQLWTTLGDKGMVPNRELISISDNTIHYKVGDAQGDMNEIVVVINNITPGDFRKIGMVLDEVVKGLGVSSLNKTYNKDEFQLKYNFKTTDSPLDVDTRIWGKISKLSDLNNIVQDTSSGNVLGYFFNVDRPVKHKIEVVFNQIDGSDYSKVGRILITTLKEIPGVDDFEYQYSEEDNVLNIGFFYQGENAYSIDNILWSRIKSNTDLSDLRTGAVSEDRLEYFFDSTEEVSVSGILGYFFDGNKNQIDNRIVLAIEGVNGRDYKFISTAFSKLLNSINDIGSVRYGYSVRSKTITFKVEYDGDGLFSLEDAIQRRLINDDLLNGLERGEDFGGRLIYRLGDNQFITQDDEAGEIEVNSPVSRLVEKLDKSVVYIVSDKDGGVAEGTGFFVGNNGHVMTNAHVVSKARRVYIKTLDGKEYRAEVISADQQLDVALVRLVSNKRDFPSVIVGDSSKVSKGDKIVMIGNPLGGKYEHTVMTGIISGFNREDGSMQLSIPSYPGSSGSPIFDSKGNVIAILRARAVTENAKVVKIKKEMVTLRTIEAVENIGLAIPINYVRPLLSTVN